MIRSLLRTLAGLFVLLLLGLPALAADKAIIILDASGSMWAQIEGKPRIEIARETLKQVLEGVPAHLELGFMAYGHRSKGDCNDIEMLVDPAPGTATVEDVVAWEARSNRLFELIDGVLVEKTMSSFESFLAAMLVRLIGNFVYPKNLGIVLGADGMLRIMPDMIRIPDVCFIAKEKLPGRFSPDIPVSSLVPDLAVEVLSRHNTQQEMEEKLDDYFEVGVREVWYIDPKPRRVRVYETRTTLRELTEADTLDSRVALPGFSMSLKELFADPVGEQALS